MKHMYFCTIAVFCALLLANCQSNKAKSDLTDNTEEIINDGDNDSNHVHDEEENIGDGNIDDDYLLDGEDEEIPEELIMERRLSWITYKLDWTALKEGCKPITKNGFHVIRLHNTDEVNNTDTTGIFDNDNTANDEEYPYTLRNKRYVLENGKNIIYNPNMTVDDFGLIGTKECVMHLAAIKMRTDPRIKDSESFNDIYNEMRYFLLYRDENVKQSIKDIAEEHYLAACNSFDEQGDLQKVLKTTKMRMIFNPSHAKGIIAIEFDFDKNGYLRVKSAYIEYVKFDISNEGHWMSFV